MRPYDEDTGQGFLRHVLIKRGFATNQIMVVLVTSTKVFPGKNNYIKAIRKVHPEISTIIMNINNRKTSVVLGSEEVTLYGRGYIEDVLCGVRFQISAKSFYQVNPIQTEVLYNKAIEMAGLKGDETVIDAYCGIGTIGLILSHKVKDVIGVELNNDAVKDAIKNARNNNIKNAYFHNDDAGDFMVKLADDNKKIDLVIMDPPRAGSDEKFLSSLVKLSPDKVVYISCNPITQERDLRYLVKNGYEVKEIQPVDMFPQTNHVETVVSLSHKKADSHIHVNIEFGEGDGKIPVDKIAQKAEDYRPSERVTYKMIQEYIESKYDFKVHTAYIAEVKRSLGLPMYDAPNAVEELKHERKHPTPEKVEAIKDAFKYFKLIH